MTKASSPPARPAGPHIATLVIASALGPLALNVFLPSLPAMARHFDTDYSVMQLTLSLYLVAMAVLQLLVGPVSDRFGRRPVMLTCFSVFVLATAAAIVAPTVEFLLVCRMFQASAAAGMVLSRAIVGDTLGSGHAASRIGYITMGMTLAPMIAPAMGGLLDEAYGWQATFVMTLLLGLVAIIVVYFNLEETNLNRSPSLGVQFRAYPQLIRSIPFWGYALTAASASGVFFAFIGGAPYISTEVLGLTPSTYGFYFAIVAVGYMTGNFLTGRFSGRYGVNGMMMTGNLIAFFGVLLASALFAVGIIHPLSLFGPMAMIAIGNGLTLPNANAGMVSMEPLLAGSASGLGGALQIGGGAALSVLAGLYLTPVSGPFPMFAVMLLTTVAAIAASLFVIASTRRRDP